MTNDLGPQICGRLKNRRNTEFECKAVNSNLNNDAVNGGSNTLEGENIKANEAIPVLGKQVIFF